MEQSLRKWSAYLCTYLWRSNARTVPSHEALTTTLSVELKVMLDTAEECSVNVTKQNPVNVFHSFTWGGGRERERGRGREGGREGEFFILISPVGISPQHLMAAINTSSMPHYSSGSLSLSPSLSLSLWHGMHTPPPKSLHISTCSGHSS